MIGPTVSTLGQVALERFPPALASLSGTALDHPGAAFEIPGVALDIPGIPLDLAAIPLDLAAIPLDILGFAFTPTPGVALSLASLLGIAVAALASLAVAAGIAVYLLRNRPATFLSFRKLRPEPDRDDDADEIE